MCTIFSKVVDQFEDAITGAVKVPLSQNQFNAFVSFTYNAGVTAFNKTWFQEVNQQSTLYG
jgi:lysozyme